LIDVDAIVTDVEGTTSAIAFVKDVLFPYADVRLNSYVAAHRDDRAVAEVLREAAALAGEPGATDAQILAHLHAWMAEDRKAGPLKTLQGLIWQEGYESKGLQGHVYPDAIRVLRAWHVAGIRLFVYSSGSIVAQRTLFGHTHAGNLNPLFSGNFDTATGAKGDPASYAAIAGTIGDPIDRILFLSDVDAELDAARAAGMQTARLMRPVDTPPGATTSHPAYTDFTALARDVTRSKEQS
jgi:enolase-phosphatase E1